MRKLSQKELLEEGFLDAIRGVGKAAIRGALAATKGAAKIISPTGAGIIGSAADAVGSTIANIATSSPTVGLKAFLSRPENKRLFRSYKIQREKKLENGDRVIQISGEFIDPNTQAVTPITTNVVFQRTDSGGIESEKWSPVGEFNTQTGQFQVKQKKKKKQNSSSTSNTLQPVPAPLRKKNNRPGRV